MEVALRQYCVYKQPTPDEVKAGKRTEVLLQPSDWILGTEEEVRMRAIRAIPDTEIANASRLAVVIRTF